MWTMTNKDKWRTQRCIFCVTMFVQSFIQTGLPGKEEIGCMQTYIRTILTVRHLLFIFHQRDAHMHSVSLCTRVEEKLVK